MTPYRQAPANEPDVPRVPLRWIPRERPLDPRGAAHRGEGAKALVERLLACTDGALRALRGVAAGGDVVILGDEVPWVPEALWLGRDPDAPGWLLPTALRTDLPMALVRAALARHGVQTGLPHAVWPDARGLRVVPLGEARPLTRDRLRGWGASTS